MPSGYPNMSAGCAFAAAERRLEATVLRVDRASVRDAQFVIEWLIPDAEVRLRWLTLLGDAMNVADRVHWRLMGRHTFRRRPAPQRQNHRDGGLSYERRDAGP